MSRFCTLFALLAMVAFSSAIASDVGPVPDAVQREFHLAPFYQKYLDLDGMPIVASGKVSDYALLEAAWTIRHMLPGREDIIRAIAASHIRLSVMAWNEFTTDVPEHSTLSPQPYWDRRARGLGATFVRPSSSCAEENLLGYPGDPYRQENILIHEFSHTIHEIGLKAVDRTFDGRLRAAFDAARKASLWEGTYSSTNHKEYWAEGAQAWFNAASARVTRGVETREKLKEYDPGLAKLCAEVFGDGEWRYHRPVDRTPEERTHLEGFDASKAPRFVWRKELTPDSKGDRVQP